jgi:hypothetical protein
MRRVGIKDSAGKTHWGFASQIGAHNADDFVDMAGYSAVAGECRARELCVDIPTG